MRLLSIMIITILLTSCGNLRYNTPGVSAERIGDNSVILFNDEDVKIKPDGSIKSDITTILVIDVQKKEDAKAIFHDAFLMLSKFFKEHAEVYESIGAP
jgi:hypothetical protein